MSSSKYQPTYTPSIKDYRPGIMPMTGYLDRNEKAWWLLQVRLTPFSASKAGIKYEPETWQGTPLIRVVWVNRDGALAEFHEWLESGEEVQVPCVWELNVEEAIFLADRYSVLGVEQTDEWLREAQEASTLIDDVAAYEEMKTQMALNRSSFGPGVSIQRNGFPQELRKQKFYESGKAWR